MRFSKKKCYLKKHSLVKCNILVHKFVHIFLLLWQLSVSKKKTAARWLLSSNEDYFVRKKVDFVLLKSSKATINGDAEIKAVHWKIISVKIA